MTREQAIAKMEQLIANRNTSMYGWKLIDDPNRRGVYKNDTILEYKYETLVHWTTLLIIQREFDEVINLGNCIITPTYVRLRLNI